MIEMETDGLRNESKFLLHADSLGRLFDQLRFRNYKIAGPTIRDCSIVYDYLDSPQQLPLGVAVEQQPGFYRVKKRREAGYFTHMPGAQTWKKFLYPPRLSLLKAARVNGDLTLSAESATKPTPLALIGIRACEIKALQIQDKVFLGGNYIDTDYEARRKSAFLVAVNCTDPTGNCFCDSMNSGPGVTDGFDLALTEFSDPDQHLFVVSIGTTRGQEIVDELKLGLASPEMVAREKSLMSESATKMGRSLDTRHVKELLYRNDEHPRWKQVGDRCLNCSSCTMVCPTCFCMTVEDCISLDGNSSERIRRWDSCFTVEFSYIHGCSVRTTASARYRHWLTHKLASWQDQFGMIGCVGCGRCITWCPVGIDITEEVEAIRSTGR